MLLAAAALAIPWSTQAAHLEYICPDNSQELTPHPYFIGDCECNYGYERKDNDCAAMPTPFWAMFCVFCIAIPTAYYLWKHPPPKPILVWCVYKWKSWREDTTEGMHYCVFGSTMWPRMAIVFSYFSILLMPLNACCWKVSPVSTKDKKSVSVLTYSCIPEEASVGSEYSDYSDYSYGYSDASGSSRKKSAVADNNWEEFIDPESGHPYFIHKISKVTVWDKPNK
jgi:hypothetical protein